MKIHIHSYLTILAALTLAAACTEEVPTDKEILDGRISAGENLTVSYSTGGAEVRSLAYTHAATRQVVDVTVNNDNLIWDIESDSPWCTVVPAEHRGSGPVTLEIAVNESFEAREPATLTFVAGEYRGFEVQVTQNASAFILSQPYFTVSRAGGSYTTIVTTPEGTDFSVEGESWLKVSKTSMESHDGLSTSLITIDPSPNTGDSRYGAVTLKSGSETESVWFYQFGNDFEYDESGRIVIPGDVESTFSFTAPAFVVKSVEVPSFANASVTENGDGTATVSILLDRNLSDCGEYREVGMSLLLANDAAYVVELPTLMQNYVAAHGLVTAKGLQAFAQAIAEGTSTADWEKDGVVTVIQDIDMSDVEDWNGIGSASKPFTGTFDGDGHAVVNLRNAHYALFNHCQGATVQNISLGKGCSVYNNEEYGQKGCFGGIVSVAEGTTISGCGLTGTIEYAGTSESDEPCVYVGGIVGWADAATTIQRCSMSGKVIVSSPTASEVTCYEGGIAGLCLGGISACEVIGNVTFSSGIATTRVGGIEAALLEGAKVENNSFMGVVTLGGNASNAAVGGLYGSIESNRSFDGATDKSIATGNIQLNGFYASATSNLFAGGFAGFASQGIQLSFKDYEAQTNLLLDASPSALAARNVCLGGILGGCDANGAVSSLSFSGIQTTGSVKVKYDTAVGCQIRRLWLGGLAGYVNGPATFKGCANKGEVGKPEGGLYCAKSNGYNETVGGIVGYAHGGDITLEDCANQANIYNSQYNNNGTAGAWDGMYTPSVAGGIIGAFNYNLEVESYKLTVTSCSNIREVSSYRGYTGGIVGYCYNADIKSCSNQGREDNGTNDLAAYRGGIVGGAGNAVISDCTAVCDIQAKVYGSADNASAGGILGLGRGEEAIRIEGCAYYGIMKASKMSTEKPEYPGGIVGCGTDNCTVSNCRYGGTVQGVEITENNVATKSNVIGNGNEAGTVSGISYWNGKL